MSLVSRIRTPYPHTFNGNAKRRIPVCTGQLELVLSDDGVYVCCNECSEGYRFEFKLINVPGDRDE